MGRCHGTTAWGRWIPPWAIFVVVLQPSGASIGGTAAGRVSPLLLLDRATMMKTREKASLGGLKTELAMLRADAEMLYAGTNASWTDGAGPWAVTDKAAGDAAATGNPHDYYTTATDYWPCKSTCNTTIFPGPTCDSWLAGWNPTNVHPCNNKTGLPWLCHDGFANPVNDFHDFHRFSNLVNAVPTLALSAFLGGNVSHANRAAALTRAWFLTPATAMVRRSLRQQHFLQRRAGSVCDLRLTRCRCPLSAAAEPAVRASSAGEFERHARRDHRLERAPHTARHPGWPVADRG